MNVACEWTAFSKQGRYSDDSVKIQYHIYVVMTAPYCIINTHRDDGLRRTGNTILCVCVCMCILRNMVLKLDRMSRRPL